MREKNAHPSDLPQQIFRIHGIIATKVIMKVVIGWISGKTWWLYSCTNPPVFEELFVAFFVTITAALSAIL